MPPARHVPFTIEFFDRFYSGAWSLDGTMLRVSSAYGSDQAPIGDMDAEALAKILLSEIVRKYVGAH